ncbi:hypothetical protein L6452_25039 [Arctium lappa]|uniref:Uncharacterized protein n=1 Tax=Arctium lappa TaxID=4217 RepID=A0ACB9A9R9_ARCLA|nr:hypothetical protein L6452_25039 [Arctium lappa]
MPRSFRVGSPLPIDLEIEKTAKKLRKQAKLRKKQGESTSSPVVNIWKDIELSTDSESDKEEVHFEEEKPHPEKEEPITETEGEEEDMAEPNEDPFKHMTEFHMGVAILLTAGFITTWPQMARAFLDKFFPASKAAGLRREICGIKQKDTESLYEYWEHFKRLCVSCPQHGISEQLLIQYFYEGLLPMERKMMDAASGGAIVNKTPTEARNLIDTMAENSKQFGARSDIGRGASELAMGNVSQVKACEFFSSVAHPTDACPTLHEEEEQVNAIGGGNFQHSHNRALDPFSSTYNPGWRQHPNLSYAPRQPQGQGQQFQQKAPFQQAQQFQTPPGFQQPSQQQFQPKLKCHLKLLVAQATVGQLVNKGKLPSQTETNPKSNVNAITLRSGKELKDTVDKKKMKVHDDEEELEVKASSSGEKDVKEEETKKKTPEVIVQAPPFPSRFEKTKREREEKKILDTFRKVQVNIPLLDAIKQVPRYAKFLKELCTNKRKLKGNEKISMNQNVSAVLQKRLPPKCNDPGMFTIPCKVGNVSVNQAMLDLGASINVMPYAIYSSLDVGPLKPTGVVIQLADRSTVYPKGVLEDVLVQVNELVFPADFYVIDMEDNNTSKAGMILLGRPFLKTSKTKIDVHDGNLTMEFDGEIIKFNIYDAMRYPSDVSSLCFVDIIESLSDTMYDRSNDDVLEAILDRT